MFTSTIEAQEPPFLRRLREQQAGRGDPDRHERPLARPRRAKKDDDEDDGPTYVDEATNSTLSKEEYAALVSGSQDAPASVSEQANDGDTADPVNESPAVPDPPATAEQPRTRQEISEAGKNLKKRKVVKAVGVGHDEEDEAAKEEEGTAPKGSSSKKPKLKKPKTANALKLSFGTDDG